MEEKNIFKQFQYPIKEVPIGLKAKVLEDVENAKLFTEMAELFSSRYGEVAQSIFKKVKKIYRSNNQ